VRRLSVSPGSATAPSEAASVSAAPRREVGKANRMSMSASGWLRARAAARRGPHSVRVGAR
jgi:hypothetical protein